MKRLISILLTMVLVLSVTMTTFAAAFEIDPYAATDGMSQSWYQGYEPSISYNTMTICLPIRSEANTGDITVSLALDDPNVFLFASEPKAVTVSMKDGIYPVKLSLALERNRRNGDYPATITIKGADEAGKEVVETIPYVIRIRDGWDSHETMGPVISDVAGELNAGSNGSLNLTISNPTTTQSIMNGKLTVTDSTGDILMSGSNQVSVEEILPGQSQTVTLPMIVKGNASISPHILEVKFSYSSLGKDAQWQGTFTVPVTQGIRLEHGGVELPSAVAGKLTTMTLPLMNMGKGELQNVLVKLEMEGVLDAQSVLVGTVLSGETKEARLSFTPKENAVGDHSGIVTITCEDVYGNPFSQTLEVTLAVEEPVSEAELQQEEEKEKIGTGTIVLIILSVLLVAALAVQGAVLSRKIHKLEEERL